MIDILLLALGILGVAVASVSDLKTREVPDWVSYGMIASGFGLRAIHGLETGVYGLLLQGVLAFGAAFVLANLFYYGKQWGGGDSKLLIGIGAVFGNGLVLPFVKPTESWPFLVTFLLNLFILGALYGIFFALGLGMKHRKALSSEVRGEYLHFIKRGSFKAGISLFVIALLLSVFLFEGASRFLGVSISIFVLVLVTAFFMIKRVEKVALQRWTDVNKLTEGDWVLSTVKKGGRTLCSPNDLGLTKYQIDLLKKSDVKKVLVKEGIPFVPSFFLALVATLFFGNLLLLFF